MRLLCTYVIYVEHKKAMYPSFENMVLKMNMIQNNTHYHKLKYVFGPDIPVD